MIVGWTPLQALAFALVLSLIAGPLIYPVITR